MAPFRLARPRILAFFALEVGLVVGVVYALATLTLHMSPRIEGTPQILGASVFAISLMFSTVLVGTQTAGFSDHHRFRRETLLFSFVSIIFGLLAFSAIWVLFPESRPLPGLLALEAAVAVPGTVALWRWLSRRLDVLNAMRERVLILGTGQAAQQFCRWIASQHANEYAVVGFADMDARRTGTVLTMGVRVQTDYDSLPTFCQHRVDRVIVALEEKRGTLPVLPLMDLRMRGIEIEEATSFYERASGKIAVETMLPSWLIFSEGFKSTPLRAFLKRLGDVTLSVMLLVPAAPLMALTALLIKLDSRGPVLYRQDRMGKDGQTFHLLKFRSMKHRAESESGPTWTIRNDPRITRVGRVIRKLRIDELPQLVNVLRGEMSFVGPRPEREYFVRQLVQRIPYYALRMTVRPGITGWAQVEYGYGASEAESLEKLKYDLYYIKNANVLLDLWIVLKTTKVVLFGTGAR
jgi:sugar transferase (PEP-CTERM system associated)